MEKLREDLVDEKINELIDISNVSCKEYKRESLVDIVKTIVCITADECCEDCKGCRELNGCVLTRIREGFDNIFGSLNSEDL